MAPAAPAAMGGWGWELVKFVRISRTVRRLGQGTLVRCGTKERRAEEWGYCECRRKTQRGVAAAFRPEKEDKATELQEGFAGLHWLWADGWLLASVQIGLHPDSGQQFGLFFYLAWSRESQETSWFGPNDFVLATFFLEKRFCACDWFGRSKGLKRIKRMGGLQPLLIDLVGKGFGFFVFIWDTAGTWDGKWNVHLYYAKEFTVRGYNVSEA
jgi:hypothetical protein